MVARFLMYTSVYFHKTVRIAEMMMCKAVESAPQEVLEDMFIDTDCSLSSKLASQEARRPGSRPCCATAAYTRRYTPCRSRPWTTSALRRSSPGEI